MQELVVVIGGPLGGLATSRDDDTRTIARKVCWWRDGGGQVHNPGNGAHDASTVMNEAYEFPHAGISAKIDDPAQGRVAISDRADLYESNAPVEMIDDGLPAFGRPPLDSAVGLAAGDDDPVGHVEPEDFRHLRRPGALQGMKVNVAAEFGGADAEVELPIQVFDEAVDDVVRRAVALLQQGEVALDGFRLIVPQRGEPGIVQPEVIERGPDIGEKLAGIAAVQISHGSGEQDDIAQGVPAAEDQPLP